MPGGFCGVPGGLCGVPGGLFSVATLAQRVFNLLNCSANRCLGCFIRSMTQTVYTLELVLDDGTIHLRTLGGDVICLHTDQEVLTTSCRRVVRLANARRGLRATSRGHICHQDARLPSTSSIALHWETLVIDYELLSRTFRRRWGVWDVEVRSLHGNRLWCIHILEDEGPHLTCRQLTWRLNADRGVQPEDLPQYSRDDGDPGPVSRIWAHDLLQSAGTCVWDLFPAADEPLRQEGHQASRPATC